MGSISSAFKSSKDQEKEEQKNYKFNIPAKKDTKKRSRQSVPSIPVYYNTDQYDEFLLPVLSNISSDINICLELCSIQRNLCSNFAIYAINLATDRLQEFLDQSRLQNIRAQYQNVLIVCFKTGKNSKQFKKIQNCNFILFVKK
jgi:hypothetical protein